MNDITAAQIRAARAMLGINAEELANAAMLGVATVRRAEASDGIPRITTANLAAIQRALEWHGIRFTKYGVELLPEDIRENPTLNVTITRSQSDDD